MSEWSLRPAVSRVGPRLPTSAARRRPASWYAAMPAGYSAWVGGATESRALSVSFMAMEAIRAALLSGQ